MNKPKRIMVQNVTQAAISFQPQGTGLASQGVTMVLSEETRVAARHKTLTLAAARQAAETLRLRELIRRMPAVRMDKVQRMRQLIARGKLETPNRIEETVRRLAAELWP
jgi:hypothetical protein